MPTTHPKRKVAIIVSRFNRFGSEIMSAIGQYVYDHPHWETDHLDLAMETIPPPWLADWRGDGIIVRDQNGECYPFAVATGAKVVDLSIYRFPGRPTIHANNEEYIKLCIHHFQERCLRNFGFVGISGLQFSDVRRHFFEQFTGLHGHVFEFHRTDVATNTSPQYERTRLQKWLLDLPKPIGIIGVYDPIGVQILEICEKTGIRVPDEIAVIGINNDEAFCRLAKPPMSSVIIDGFRTGYAACELLESLMDGNPPPETPLQIPSLGLVTRQSTDVIALANPQIVRAIRFLRQNAALGIKVEDVAQYAGMNRRTLERKFQEIFHRTPLMELQKIRLETACRLLRETTLSVKQIAKKAGFNCITTFYQAFQAQIGQMPKEYRREKQIPDLS